MNIYSVNKGEKIEVDSFHNCWEIAIKDGNSCKNLPVEEFEFKQLTDHSAKFVHKVLTLEVILTWSNIAWANCNIAFKTDQSVRVMSITFKTPEKILLEGDEEESYLMYPFKTGMKIPNPSKTLFNDFKRKDTRYGPAEKTRHLNVIQKGLPPITDAEISTDEVEVNDVLIDFTQKIVSDTAVWGREQSYSYPGGTSMTWMDYCGPDGGIYFAAHDKCLEKARMFFAADRGEPGITLGIDKILNRHLTEWDCDFVIGEHKGDWHQGADLYREYINSIIPKVVDTPEFFKKSPGYVTHYDLKWEEGTITHRYCDIPEMHQEAKKHGFDTLLLGGWNNGGFDNYTLNYANDADLGSESELKDAIKKVHDADGKILLYVNALSISMDNPSYTEEGHNYGITKLDGEVDCFGEFFLEHPMATLCNSEAAWRKKIKENIKYVLLELGADGLYLDQIGSAPRECYTETHNHDKAWAENYRIVLSEIREELNELGREDYILLTEYPMDLYKDLIDSFLCYSFWQSSNELCEPAMYRYAFPEVQLIDMVLQKPWLGRLDSLEAELAQETFCRQFISGLKYWAYCHAPKNRALEPIFDNTIKLHKYAVDYFSYGEYLDDVNIKDKSSDILVKEFAIEGKGRLFAIWNPKGKEVQFSPSDPVEGTIVRRDLSNPDRAVELSSLSTGKDLLAIIEVK